MPDPDIYTTAWWRQQMRGVTHSINRCNAEYVSAQEQIEALTARTTQLETDLAHAQAAIGQLREELDEKLETIRKVYCELKNGGR